MMEMLGTPFWLPKWQFFIDIIIKIVEVPVTIKLGFKSKWFAKAMHLLMLNKDLFNLLATT